MSVGYAGREPGPSPWLNSMLAPCELRECPQGLGSSHIKPTMEVSPGDLEQDCSHRVVVNTVWELMKTEAARKSHPSEINTHHLCQADMVSGQVPSSPVISSSDGSS